MGGTTVHATLPFAPDLDRWTDDHYEIYSLVELVLGNREELTPEDRRDLKIAQTADELIDSGDPDWLKKITEMMNEEGFENLDIDKEILSEIDAEQRLRGE